MADLSGEELEKFREAVLKAAETMEEARNLAKELQDDERDRNRELDKEFSKLGLTLGDHNKVVEKDTKSLEDRAKNEKLVNDALIESGKVRADATKEEIEAYKLTQQQNTLYKAQLEAMGRTIDEYGKITDTTVRMNKADLLLLNSIQRQEEAIKKHEQAIVGSANALMDLPKKIGVMAVKYAFDRLIGGIDATYRGMVAYESALLAGANDEVSMGIERRELMQAEADAHGNLGESMKGLGIDMAIVGGSAVAGGAAISMAGGAAKLFSIGLKVAMGPIGLLVGAITAAAGIFLWFKGREQEQIKKSIEYQKQRDEDLGKQNKTLYEGYEKLAEVSLVGSRGLQGMFDDLQKVGLTVSQFEKLNKVLQASRKDMTLFGAGAVDGAKQFAENAGKLINSELGGQLRAMGINQEDQMAHMANFMAQQSRFSQKTNGDQTKAAANYIQELDKLATVTGASRKEQEDARKAILSINQLRAAMLEAEKKGDTKTLEKLQRAYETSSALYAAGLKEEGGALAKLMAAGGAPTDRETARVQQAMGGKGGAIEMIETGQGSQLDRAKAGISGLAKREEQFASTTKYTGEIEGVTTKNLAVLMDLTKSNGKLEEALKKSGMTTDEYAASQRKAAADAEKATKARIAQQEVMLGKDKGLREGTLTYPGSPEADQAKIVSEFGDGVKSFISGVDKWIGNVADSMFGEGWWAKYGPGGEQDQANWRITKELFNNMWDDAGKEFGPWWDKYGIGGEQDKKNWEITKKAFDDMWTGTKSMTSELSSTFSKIGKDFGKSLEDVVNGMITAIKNLINMIPGAGAAIDKAKEVGGKAASAVSGAASSVAGAASSAWGGVTGYFGGGGGAAAPAAGGSRGGAAAPASAAGGGGGGAAAPASATRGMGGGGGATPASAAGGGRGSQGSMNTPSAPSSGQSVAAANAELEKYAKTTGGGALAANITKFESGAAGYNAYNRGTVGNKMIGSDKPIDFSKMTIAEYLQHGRLKSGDPDKIFAMGKYQIIPETMAGLVKNLRLDPEKTLLDKDTQDLLFNEGIIKQSRRNVAAYLSGQSNDRDAAILDMSKEFASVGVPFPAGKAKERGESYYAGVGGNKAHNPPEAVGAALDADRKTKISALEGGITDGPKSGYPATLHGNEIIAPLSPNSILEQLGKTPASSVETTKTSESSTSDTIKEIYSMNTDVMEMLAEKLDTMISKLSDSNDTQSKLLMYSRV